MDIVLGCDAFKYLQLTHHGIFASDSPESVQDPSAG